MKLSEYLEEYKTLTLDLIDEAKKGADLDSLIEKRGQVLKIINDIKFEKEEFKTIVSSLKILELEDELQNYIKKETVRVKKQIENLKKTRQANNKYNNFENITGMLNKSI